MVSSIGPPLVRLPSTVNFVTVFERNGVRLVKKAFGRQALSTGIELPVSRCTIERRVHDTVAGMVSRRIRLPNIIQQGSSDTETIYEFVSGVPLRHLALGQWPHPSTFAALGSFLASVEKVSSEQTAKIFEGLEDVERRLRATILSFKIGRTCIDTGVDALCLGDVGLNNLIWDGNTLYIFDFEFSHREAFGFDVGQLCAELEAREVAFSLPKHFKAAVVTGYESGGGPGQGMRAWNDRFRSYYRAKYL